MLLDADEQAMLAGERGRALQQALELQLAVGRFYDAERMVPVTNAHMMGDIEVMGDAGLEHLRRLSEDGAHCRIGISTNARCFDFAWTGRLGQDEDEARKECQAAIDAPFDPDWTPEDKRFKETAKRLLRDLAR